MTAVDVEVGIVRTTVDVGPSASVRDLLVLIGAFNDVLDFAVGVHLLTTPLPASPSAKAAGRLEPEMRREQILSVAERVVVGRLPSEVTFDEIAGAAEVSRALIYNYFKDRRGLFEALDERSSRRHEVLSVRYENPLEILVAVGVVGPLVVALLRIARDWGPHRRKLNAEATVAEAQARFVSALVDEAVTVGLGQATEDQIREAATMALGKAAVDALQVLGRAEASGEVVG